jgi:hypothetical protein
MAYKLIIFRGSYLSGGRSLPHFQHEVNWPSIASPQSGQIQCIMSLNIGIAQSVHYLFGSCVVLVIKNPDFGRALCRCQLTKRHQEMLISDHAGNVSLIKQALNDLLIGAHSRRCEYVLHKFPSYLPCELLQVFRQLQKLPYPSITLKQPAQQAIES